MHALVKFEPPDKVVASTAIPLVVYGCPDCGFVAGFNANMLLADSS